MRKLARTNIFNTLKYNGNESDYLCAVQFDLKGSC